VVKIERYTGVIFLSSFFSHKVKLSFNPRLSLKIKPDDNSLNMNKAPTIFTFSKKVVIKIEKKIYKIFTKIL